MPATISYAVHTFESLNPGDTFENYRFISADDVRVFADVTGDDNPIHVDKSYAEGTRFGHRIVHAVFLLGLISKVLGRDFPGPGCVAVTITCRFLRPVSVNSNVRVEVKIVEKLPKRRQVRAKTYVYTDQNKVAVAGEVTLIPPGETDMRA